MTLPHSSPSLPTTHQALRGLQQGSQQVDFPHMQEAIEQAFGEPLSALFDKFDAIPVASASVGQVYRGSWDGKQVAVKVQYPGIWDTIHSDFSTLHRLSKVASLVTSVDGPRMVEELRKRFGEECDYNKEAQHQEDFRQAFDGDKEIVIPKVYHERTCQTVLTTEWFDGDDFYTTLSKSTPDAKNRIAKILMRFAYHNVYQRNKINADPHPGNYLFLPDHRVVCLDFGCTVVFSPAFVAQEEGLLRVVLENRRANFRDALLATGMIAKPHKFDFDFHWEMLSYQFRPYLSSSFQFTPDYLQESMHFNGPSNPNLRLLAFPPAWIWLQRLQWGLHAVLTQLRAHGDFRALLESCLERPKPMEETELKEEVESEGKKRERKKERESG